MLKKVYEFIIRQFQVKNRKDVLLLPLRLAAAYLIVRKIADDIHFFRCAWQYRYYETMILYVAECGALIFLIGLFWKLLNFLKKKKKLVGFMIFFVIFNFFTVLITQSICFVYFFDGPYFGRVTDADTGEPIEGAIVNCFWEIWHTEYLWFGMNTALADTHETVTGKNGWFVFSFGSKIWVRPFSVMYRSGIRVFAEGYDSYPPTMQWSWTPGQSKEWEKKLRQLYPDHPARNSGTDIETDDYGKDLYAAIFSQVTDSDPFMNIHLNRPRFFDIRINKARTVRERKEVIRRLEPKKCNCRAEKFYNAVREEKKRLESMAPTE
ncbi:carboxypeptidase-like regulatory domain-containing protein [Desulfonema ishimotonii]|uniref:carboxypeptidase-like regulatory domain-containing protein n=1 Tax=Desulfonema ishimotonii TaxID=45657 RepID=UPI000F566A44|nr:carboxypeptidase-like regulatory domain-containing protein [Desulfonema ishimotonii]